MLGFPRKPSSDPVELPAELVEAIRTAQVVWREGDGEHEPRAVVMVAGLGSFHPDGTGPISDRVARHYPDLPPTACRRAAKLITQQVAHKARGAGRGKRRKGWVHNW